MTLPDTDRWITVIDEYCVITITDTARIALLPNGRD